MPEQSDGFVPVSAPAVGIESPDGRKEWRRDGKLHREDGPAIEWDTGARFWYRNNRLHRDDGPAAEYANGEKGGIGTASGTVRTGPQSSTPTAERDRR